MDPSRKAYVYQRLYAIVTGDAYRPADVAADVAADARR
jgi:hypothetical protein